MQIAEVAAVGVAAASAVVTVLLLLPVLPAAVLPLGVLTSACAKAEPVCLPRVRVEGEVSVQCFGLQRLKALPSRLAD